MSQQDQRPLSPLWLTISTLGALAAAAVILLGAILPAEFGVDPLGLGKLSGVSRLWAPDEIQADVKTSEGPRAREYPAGFRSDVIEIPLGTVGGGIGPYGLEYKVAMKKDATLIYEWQAVGLAAPGDLTYDFHGHTIADGPGEKMVVATYKQSKGDHAQGALVAPFDGIEGWYFENTGTKGAFVRVKLSGFYDLIPAGGPGNELGIVANVPAEKALPPVKFENKR
jgi:hypothetical protein